MESKCLSQHSALQLSAERHRLGSVGNESPGLDQGEGYLTNTDPATGPLELERYFLSIPKTLLSLIPEMFTEHWF